MSNDTSSSTYGRTLEEDRSITIQNMNNDIFKLEIALRSVEGLTPEGEIIREDLLGLLYFESDSQHQIDSLMSERKKIEKTRNLFLPLKIRKNPR